MSCFFIDPGLEEMIAVELILLKPLIWVQWIIIMNACGNWHFSGTLTTFSFRQMHQFALKIKFPSACQLKMSVPIIVPLPIVQQLWINLVFFWHKQRNKTIFLMATKNFLCSKPHFLITRKFSSSKTIVSDCFWLSQTVKTAGRDCHKDVW